MLGLGLHVMGAFCALGVTAGMQFQVWLFEGDFDTVAVSEGKNEGNGQEQTCVNKFWLSGLKYLIGSTGISLNPVQKSATRGTGRNAKRHSSAPSWPVTTYDSAAAAQCLLRGGASANSGKHGAPVGAGWLCRSLHSAWFPGDLYTRIQSHFICFEVLVLL